MRAAIEEAIAADGSVPTLVVDRTVSVPEVQVVDVDFDSKPDWVTDYRRYRDYGGLVRDVKTAEGKRDLRTFFTSAIQAEAPVHKEVLLERFKDEWGIQRLRAATRQIAEASCCRGSGRAFRVARQRRRVPSPLVSRVPSSGSRSRTAAPQARAHPVRGTRSAVAPSFRRAASIVDGVRVLNDVRNARSSSSNGMCSSLRAAVREREPELRDAAYQETAHVVVAGRHGTPVHFHGTQDVLRDLPRRGPEPLDAPLVLEPFEENLLVDRGFRLDRARKERP
ncbi:DUF3320 domain-containing protein [Rhodococcus hoagii]|nr:DUF3320 domain-containing protein [Prescottella equi]